ncbi:hypothetical protein IFM89_026084 [Coptis chinensis]|uniref:Uncharacterized protein n=1 Tax=Coptis chinensis TaxID=261450 RepID=A0A835LJT6_9MAGN|nr:hypothetical protein IFM89_026084 [Coptis chinensis]
MLIDFCSPAIAYTVQLLHYFQIKPFKTTDTEFIRQTFYNVPQTLGACNGFVYISEIVVVDYTWLPRNPIYVFNPITKQTGELPKFTVPKRNVPGWVDEGATFRVRTLLDQIDLEFVVFQRKESKCRRNAWDALVCPVPVLPPLFQILQKSSALLEFRTNTREKNKQEALQPLKSATPIASWSTSNCWETFKRVQKRDEQYLEAHPLVGSHISLKPAFGMDSGARKIERGETLDNLT